METNADLIPFFADTNVNGQILVFYRNPVELINLSFKVSVFDLTPDLVPDQNYLTS